MIPEHVDMPEVTSLHNEGFKRQIAAVCTALDFYAAWRKGRGGGTVLVYVPAVSLFDMLDSPILRVRLLSSTLKAVCRSIASRTAARPMMMPTLIPWSN